MFWDESVSLTWWRMIVFCLPLSCSCARYTSRARLMPLITTGPCVVRSTPKPWSCGRFWKKSGAQKRWGKCPSRRAVFFKLFLIGALHSNLKMGRASDAGHMMTVYVRLSCTDKENYGHTGTHWQQLSRHYFMSFSFKTSRTSSYLRSAI